MGHVHARLTGFGMTLIPIWPYTFDRVAHRPDNVRVTRWEGETAHTAVVTGPADIELTNYLQGPKAITWSTSAASTASSSPPSRRRRTAARSGTRPSSWPDR